MYTCAEPEEADIHPADKKQKGGDDSFWGS